jgi:hypothetical protein
MAYKTWGTEVLNAGDVNTYLMVQSIMTTTSASRPSGVTGMRIWETDTRRQMHYNGSSWVEIKEQYAFAYKTADTIINSNNGYNADPHLDVTLYNSGRYLVDLYLKYQGAPAAVSLHSLIIPVQASTSSPSPTIALLRQANAPALTGSSRIQSQWSVNAMEPFAMVGEVFSMHAPLWDTSQLCYSLRNRLINISNVTLPFRLVFSWGQEVSDSSDLTLFAGSYLWVRRASYSGI